MPTELACMFVARLKYWLEFPRISAAWHAGQRSTSLTIFSSPSSILEFRLSRAKRLILSPALILEIFCLPYIFVINKVLHELDDFAVFFNEHSILDFVRLFDQ